MRIRIAITRNALELELIFDDSTILGLSGLRVLKVGARLCVEHAQEISQSKG